jgi:ribonuclease E
VNVPSTDADDRREGGRRRRGRRGRGGDRTERPERAPQDAVAPSAALAAPLGDLTMDVAEARTPEPARNEDAFAQAPQPIEVSIVEPVAHPQPVAEPAPSEFVASAPNRSEPARPRGVADQPPISLELPSDSELVMVETRRQAVLLDEEEPAERPRQKRVRPPRIALPDEPLELVETHKEPPSAE